MSQLSALVLRGGLMVGTLSLVQIELALANCCHPSACGGGLAAQQAPIIPPLKGEVGEQSEPGGVGRNNLGRQSNPTRPPVASLRRFDLPLKGRYTEPAAAICDTHAQAGEGLRVTP